jgi:hypothetical protein
MDIDIDTQSDFNPKSIFSDAILASMVEKGELIKHHVGLYFQKIAQDPQTGLAAIPFREAEDIGYFKVDMLHLSALDNFDSKEEIRALVRIDPDWTLLQIPSVVKKLDQIKNHFEVIDAVKPKSIMELADCIALIRPGKRYLLNAYIKDKDAIRRELYRRTDKYYFKKPHAVAYAATIALQLHLVKAGLL